MDVIFHDFAEEELNEAAAYYTQIRSELGDAFLTEVQHAVELLVSAPLAGSIVDRDVRWWGVKRFPYSVIYRVRDHQIRILAIAHQKRRPFYWRGRQ